ncbi:zinc-dependent alcohol dehydrogenase [Haloactinomyces albus]|uniref:Threonine dehydrogenase-like Zn-dependent dehydrogenase n=1 Tax=Haloactinomyces albus TaxID=1352928 RepID=A0AAE3ZCN6_9ACTN|nr:alcohol dehydrogenase catalytic domain-containing protein [Haloactinomyces albus]MDR7301238.1 threonine dehydrogenase-like Zn-dependent dehydrogenase [Haloactinomyces albus]
MNAAVLTELRSIEYRETAAPEPGTNELLVKVSSTGICGSDLAAYRGTHPYKTAPAVLGHEFSGVVEAVGDEVTGFVIGDQVCSAAFSHCGTCPECLRDAGHLCGRKLNLGHLEWTGSFAERIVLRPNMTHQLPPELHPVAGALVEPLSIGLHAMRLMAEDVSKVLVLGSGTIGLSCLIAAKQLRHSYVACVDVGTEKGEPARKLGADAYVDALLGNPVDRAWKALDGPADVVVIAAGYHGVTDQALHAVRAGGEIIVVSYFDGRHPVELNTLVSSEVTVHGSALSTGRDFTEVISWLAAGAVDPLPLVTHHYRLTEAETALRLMDQAEVPTGKIMLHVSTDPDEFAEERKK